MHTTILNIHSYLSVEFEITFLLIQNLTPSSKQREKELKLKEPLADKGLNVR